MKNIPSDFTVVCEKLNDSNKLSVNSLVKTYKVSPSVITRWLNESNIFIEKQNEKKESLINLKEFSVDVCSGNFTKKEICKKYNLSSANVRNMCIRNDIAENLKSSLFSPENEEEFLKCIEKCGKAKTAQKYNITLAMVSGWCIRNDVRLQKYLGRRRIDVDSKIKDIKNLYDLGYTQTHIGKLYEVSPAKIKRLLRENGVDLKTKFDYWDENRKEILKNFDVYAMQNKNGMNLIEISESHNISYEVLKHTFKNKGIEVIIHSYNKSRGEIEVKDFIKSLGFNCESIKKTHNKVQYEIDCFVPEKNFGIEYCGEYWHSRNSGKPKKYHQDKMLWCAEQNIQLMTIFEHEWVSKKNLIKSMIKSRLDICDIKIYARNTECCVISKAQAKLFHDKNHINGGLTTSFVDFGLFYDGVLVSVASFSKPRFSKDVEYEILRFSTLQNHLIVGGFSKLFSNFIKAINPNSVLSFCDLRFGKGRVYKNANFKLCGITPPNYWYYFKNTSKIAIFESRIKYQKHKLKHFSNYSDDKTEYDIMKENGYLQIFDCGSYKYVYAKGG